MQAAILTHCRCADPERPDPSAPATQKCPAVSPTKPSALQIELARWAVNGPDASVAAHAEFQINCHAGCGLPRKQSGLPHRTQRQDCLRVQAAGSEARTWSVISTRNCSRPLNIWRMVIDADSTRTCRQPSGDQYRSEIDFASIVKRSAAPSVVSGPGMLAPLVSCRRQAS